MSRQLTIWISAAVVGLLIVVGAFALFFRQKPEPIAPAPAPVAEAPKGPVHKVVGKSVEGRTIDAYTYGTGLTHLVFVGGIHGGYEWNSVVVAYNLMDYLDARPETIPQSESITVIPSANPDGVYKIIDKEGRFAAADVPATPADQSPGRFNAHAVDLNRNFDCKWQPSGTWRNKTVSAGTAPFSEPEAAALRDYFLAEKPAAVVFWHSQAGGVYASQCGNGILPKTLDIMNAYAVSSGYPAIKEFTAYPTTGASEDWLASIGIPAITVEFKTHDSVEWDANLAGIKAVVDLFK